MQRCYVSRWKKNRNSNSRGGERWSGHVERIGNSGRRGNAGIDAGDKSPVRGQANSEHDKSHRFTDLQR